MNDDILLQINVRRADNVLGFDTSIDKCPESISKSIAMLSAIVLTAQKRIDDFTIKLNGHQKYADELS
jgi:hypothetical protein